MTQNPPIHVLLVDDNDMLRNGLVVLIDTFDDLQLVGQGKNGEEALELCTQAKPDVILMDLKMPVMDGVMATRIIGQKFPAIRVIALTSFDDEPLIQSAQDAGVFDYLLKNVTIDKIADTIRRAYADSKGSG